jgi:hypothetical protein
VPATSSQIRFPRDDVENENLRVNRSALVVRYGIRVVLRPYHPAADPRYGQLLPRVSAGRADFLPRAWHRPVAIYPTVASLQFSLLQSQHHSDGRTSVTATLALLATFMQVADRAVVISALTRLAWHSGSHRQLRVVTDAPRTRVAHSARRRRISHLAAPSYRRPVSLRGSNRPFSQVISARYRADRDRRKVVHPARSVDYSQLSA